MKHFWAFVKYRSHVGIKKIKTYSQTIEKLSDPSLGQHILQALNNSRRERERWETTVEDFYFTRFRCKACSLPRRLGTVVPVLNENNKIFEEELDF